MFTTLKQFSTNFKVGSSKKDLSFSGKNHSKNDLADLLEKVVRELFENYDKFGQLNEAYQDSQFQNIKKKQKTTSFSTETIDDELPPKN
ncbi:hypothetical protein BLOT_016782 [Blomia tropicalis]|nr:hypothetical protein BLOT_016782 [Blomia tropicalis]